LALLADLQRTIYRYKLNDALTIQDVDHGQSLSIGHIVRLNDSVDAKKEHFNNVYKPNDEVSSGFCFVGQFSVTCRDRSNFHSCDAMTFHKIRLHL